MKEKTNYINGKDLERELIHLSDTYKADVDLIMKEEKLSLKDAKKKAKGEISEELGLMFISIAENLANKNNFAGYTYIDEMKGLGIEYLCRFSKTFDKSNPKANAFSYCTQICYNGFVQAITKEKKKAELKDIMIKKHSEKSELEKWQYEEKGFIYEDDDNW
jgi:hypothetical protein